MTEGDSESDHLTPTVSAPPIILKAWEQYGDRRPIIKVDDISASVSTNKVYRVLLGDSHEVIAKTSVYGSYVYFRQDHRIVQQWSDRLVGTRYRDFLAQVCRRQDGEVFTTHIDDTAVTFYEKTSFYDFLPKILTPDQISAFGTEMAELHKVTTRIAPLISKSWKSLGSDVAALYDIASNKEWLDDHDLTPDATNYLRRQCETFLINAEKLGYHSFEKIPVLIDWNIGNFSVGLEEHGFKFYSRWDYDWLRVEPRMMDFIFCARVVREEGDQDTFSYTIAPYFEDRFLNFLRAYHQVAPLSENEVLFIKEAHRAFLLNYVVRIGEHFFRREICKRLHQEAMESYFPSLDNTDFSPLLLALK